MKKKLLPSLFLLIAFSPLLLVGQKALDLKAFPKLTYSAKYAVKTNDKLHPVFESTASYQTRTGTVEQGKGVNKMSFLNMEMPQSGSLKISVDINGDFTSFDLRPLASAPTATRAGNTLSFTVTKPQQLVLRLNGSWENTLCIFVNPYEPAPDPSSVTYYFKKDTIYDYFKGNISLIEPGSSQTDIQTRTEVGAIDLKDGESLYIDENTIVRARINVSNNAAVKIYGKGMLAYCVGHVEDFGVISANLGPKKVDIAGLTVIDAPGWIFRIFGGQNHTMNNVKTVAQWHFNTDGLQFGADGLDMKNCFMQCNDDNFSLPSTGSKMKIYDNVLWNIFNGGVINFGWGNPKYNDVQVYDNTILAAGDCCDGSTEIERRKAPFTMISYGSENLTNITFKNIVVEEIIGRGQWIHFLNRNATSSSGKVSTILFEDITILKQPLVRGILKGAGTGGGIDGVTFKNLKINGTIMNNETEAGLTLENAKNIVFEGGTGSPGGGTNNDSTSIFVNILKNPSFESDLEFWTPYFTKITSVNNLVQEGAKSVRIEHKSKFKGIQQDITEKLKEAGSGQYDIGAWLRTDFDSLKIYAIVRVETNAGPKRYYGATSIIAKSDQWLRSSGTVNIDLTDLKAAYFYVETGEDGLNDYYVDNCVMKKAATSGTSSQRADAPTLKAYPNPVSGNEFWLELPANHNAVQLTVSDALGRVIVTQSLAKNTGKTSVILPAHMAAGILHIAVWGTDNQLIGRSRITKY